ncbi:MAG: exonuclease domain-containing protein [Saprospiraceae bacterium]|nr:exonuclease domain-containing protein [Saprospiraceae bacterium]
MIFIIFDLEATCWKDTFVPHRQEVIEVGAYSVNSFGDFLDTFQKFVKPVKSPVLSSYCRSLTGIDQRDIDKSARFDVVMDQMQDWVFHFESEFVFCSWGKKDMSLLSADANDLKLDLSWITHYIDLKEQYNEMKGNNKPLGLARSLEMEKIDFEGNAHRALPDAFNLSKLFIKYLDHWRY